MLELVVTIQEGYNEEKSEFFPAKTETLRLEHSLVTLSVWESKWELPFLDSNTEKTDEMMLDYIKTMIMHDYDPDIINYLSKKNVEEINGYINSKQSATWFNERSGTAKKGPNGKIITSDLIYYWMVALTIPFECQHWHLNRLMTLIRITELENRPKKNMPRHEAMSKHRSINQARRAKRG